MKLRKKLHLWNIVLCSSAILFGWVYFEWDIAVCFIAFSCGMSVGECAPRIEDV